MSKRTTTNMSAAVTMAPRGLKWMAAGMLLAVSATVALSAWAHPGGGRHGTGMGMGMEGPAAFMPARGLDRMLDSVNATEAQRAQIGAIAQQAAADMKTIREQRRTLRQQSLQILTAPAVDAAAAESVRQQMLQLHDAGSRRMLQAMLDASRVLTPEQRAQLGQHMAQRMQRMQERMQRFDQPAQAQPQAPVR